MTLLAAESSAGKSKLSWSLIAAIVRGENWLGWNVTGSKVLVIDNENPSDDVTSHMWAFGLRDEHRDQLSYFCRQGVLLSDARYVRASLEEAAVFEPDLIVIDTATAVGNVELADNNSIARLFNTALRPMAEMGTAVLLLHHNRKPQQGQIDNARHAVLGGMQWFGQADGMLSLAAPGDMDVCEHADGTSTRDFPIWLKVEKVRQGIKGLSKDVHLWSEHDRDGVMMSMRADTPEDAARGRWLASAEAAWRATGSEAAMAERLGVKPDDPAFLRGVEALREAGRLATVDRLDF